MKPLKIRSNIRNYVVRFEDSLRFLGKLATIDPFVTIIDRKVYDLYRGELDEYFLPEQILCLEAVEETKSFEKISEFYTVLTERNAKRNITIISIGGGITQDATGFVASTLYRGVNWVFVPTTLLAQTDSCIGSKTSLNFRAYKNLIGTFYPPSEIVICPEFLNTLSDVDFYSGLGEVIKLQLMKEEDTKDVDKLKEKIESVKRDRSLLLPIIRENLGIKISYMQGDEFDRGRRVLLNYGHCFGHALETSSGYYVPHGIAVNIGMIFANLIAVYRRMLPDNVFEEITQKLNMSNIPISLRPQDLEYDVLLDCLRRDKKRVGKDLSVVIPSNGFKLVKIDNVSESEFRRALEDLKVLFELWA